MSIVSYNKIKLHEKLAYLGQEDSCRCGIISRILPYGRFHYNHVSYAHMRAHALVHTHKYTRKKRRINAILVDTKKAKLNLRYQCDASCFCRRLYGIVSKIRGRSLSLGSNPVLSFSTVRTQQGPTLSFSFLI